MFYEWPMATTPPLRFRPELLAELNARLEVFLRLDVWEQWLVDSKRLVPTVEMHDSLRYYLERGRFCDENGSHVYVGDFVWEGQVVASRSVRSYVPVHE